MNLKRIAWTVALASAGGLTAAGLTSAQEQMGTPLHGAWLPPNATPSACFDTFKFEKFVAYDVIVDSETNRTEVFEFYHKVGTRQGMFSGIFPTRDTYVFADLTAIGVDEDAILMNPKVTGSCYIGTDPYSGLVYKYVAKELWTGTPKLTEQLDDLVTTSYGPNHEDEAPPTYETWCMFRHTWNPDWSSINETEIIMCWDARVT